MLDDVCLLFGHDWVPRGAQLRRTGCSLWFECVVCGAVAYRAGADGY